MPVAPDPATGHPASPAGTRAGASPTPQLFELAAAVKAAPPGTTVRLDPRYLHVARTVDVDKPLTIDGRNSTLWASEGPVLSIKSGGVVLRNLHLEIANSDANLTGTKACALTLAPHVAVVLENVSICGDAQGLAGDAGTWRFPRSLPLGDLEANQPHTFKLKVAVPVRCQLVSEIAGLEFEPREISGPAEVTLKLDLVPEGAWLRGGIAVKSPLLSRTAVVTGRAVPKGSGTRGTGQVIYEPADWQAIVAPPAPPQPAATPQPEPPPTTKPPQPEPRPERAATEPAKVDDPRRQPAPRTASADAAATQTASKKSGDGAGTDDAATANPPQTNNENRSAKPSEHRRKIRPGDVGIFGEGSDKGP